MVAWAGQATPTMKIKVNCITCNKEFEVDKRVYTDYIKRGYRFFCSKECRSLANKVKCVCENCGKEIYKYKSEIANSKYGHVFCSKSCAASYNNSNYRRGENNPNWIDGTYKTEHYAKLAFRNYIHRCAICGLEEPCCLEVHHIDKNRQNMDLDNLVILCANCHLKVHYNKISLEELKEAQKNCLP